MRRVMVILSCTCLLAGVLADDPADGAPQRNVLDLKIGVVLSSPAPKVRFFVVNTRAEEIVTTPLATNANRIVFITPDGKEVEHASNKLFPPSALLRIAPSKNYAWEMSISEIVEIMQSRKLTAPGWYGFYWSLEGVKSDTLWLYRPEPKAKQQ